MSLAVYYTPRARETLKIVYQFIQEKFGDRVADKFITKAEETISLIALQPQMFKASHIDPSVRIGLITKQCSVFYQITGDSINLLFFWDNRQEPLAF